MAETNVFVCSKRHREEEIRQGEELKRRKSSTSASSSYNQILSILEEDEEEQIQDPSSLITILQHEISSEANPLSDHLSEPSPDANNNKASTPSNSFQLSSTEEDGDKEKVIRHLLEASDDELGIPNTEDDEIRATADIFGEVINGAREFEFSACDNLWEFEDNTANYYTFLQSELFL